MPTKSFFNLEDEKKNVLLRSAICEFSLLPYDKVSVFKIAKNAGISRSAFYYYFKDKEDIYHYIVGLVFEKLAGQLKETKEQNDVFTLGMAFFTQAAKLKGTEWEALVQQLIANMKSNDAAKLLRQMEACAAQTYFSYLKGGLENLNISSETDFLELSFLLISSVIYALRSYLMEGESFSAAEGKLERMFEMIRHGVLK
ncbi:MAG: TetR/AcrR family transcriptional regulator [Firmicutes bacterium]|nr:TetR/AcrR family transcriptional regulator [Bacillota bacterium]NBI63186.1 TetR/AcrR family transcriptional regulator [Clostridiales bacterium]